MYKVIIFSLLWALWSPLWAAKPCYPLMLSEFNLFRWAEEHHIQALPTKPQLTDLQAYDRKVEEAVATLAPDELFLQLEAYLAANFSWLAKAHGYLPGLSGESREINNILALILGPPPDYSRPYDIWDLANLKSVSGTFSFNDNPQDQGGFFATVFEIRSKKIIFDPEKWTCRTIGRKIMEALEARITSGEIRLELSGFNLNQPLSHQTFSTRIDPQIRTEGESKFVLVTGGQRYRLYLSGGKIAEIRR
ncbi:MAG: hypothetical protein WCG27_05525 [Pseudomonadota bacterium]